MAVEDTLRAHRREQVTDATIVSAEGARVGFVTCKQCGTAILIDPRDTEDAVAKHLAWHEDVAS
jgi:hypothetical protein